MASAGGAAQEPDIFSIGNVIDDTYVITARLGKGGYGEIYRANRIADGATVAVKVERVTKAGNLVEEQTILQTLYESGCKYIPHMLTTGVHEEQVHYLTMELLGENLSILRRRQENHALSLKTTCALAMQMLKGIKEVHDHGYLHRDIKPGNFVMGGAKNPRQVYIIDFGLSRRYVKPNGQLRAKRSEARWVGSRRYMSPNTHFRKDQGRRDDLWGFLYVVIELCTGTLPWAHLRGLGNLDKVRDLKVAYLNEKLVQDLPPEFNHILKHILSLSFSSRPDYRLIHSLLNKLYIEQGGNEDSPYDWEDTTRETSILGPARLSFSSIHSVNGFSDTEAAGKANGETSVTATTDTNITVDSKIDGPSKNRFGLLEDSDDFSDDSSDRRRKRHEDAQAAIAGHKQARASPRHSNVETKVVVDATATTPKKVKKKRRCIIQ